MSPLKVNENEIYSMDLGDETTMDKGNDQMRRIYNTIPSISYIKYKWLQRQEYNAEGAVKIDYKVA